VASIDRFGFRVGVGIVSIAVATPLAVGSVVGIVVLMLWLTSDSPSTYATKQVQKYVSNAGNRDAKVRACLRVAPGDEPGIAVWRCSVANRTCARTLLFEVSREYGTVPYDNNSFTAIAHGICAGTS
jgi:hypothetical protein